MTKHGIGPPNGVVTRPPPYDFAVSRLLNQAVPVPLHPTSRKNSTLCHSHRIVIDIPLRSVVGINRSTLRKSSCPCAGSRFIAVEPLCVAALSLILNIRLVFAGGIGCGASAGARIPLTQLRLSAPSKNPTRPPVASD